MPDRAVGGNPIGTGQDAADHGRDPQRMGAHIGALVVPELVVEREDHPRSIDPGAHLVALFARVVGGNEVLAPVLDPFDRPAEPHRGAAHQHVLGIKLAAHPEPAADMGSWTWIDDGLRRSIRARRSRTRCGTLAAP